MPAPSLAENMRMPPVVPVPPPVGAGPNRSSDLMKVSRSPFAADLSAIAKIGRHWMLLSALRASQYCFMTVSGMPA
jgi:hypothetical protein